MQKFLDVKSVNFTLKSFFSLIYSDGKSDILNKKGESFLDINQFRGKSWNIAKENCRNVKNFICDYISNTNESECLSVLCVCMRSTGKTVEFGTIKFVTSIIEDAD